MPFVTTYASFMRSVKAMLMHPVQPADIKAAIWADRSDKSLGPDGFGAAFYQVCWYIAGEEGTEVIMSFITVGCLLKEENSTYLAWIPKCPMVQILGLLLAVIPSTRLFLLL